MAPSMVPISALATVNPRPCGLSSNFAVSAAVVPAMTAVSKPNSNPPSAATTVLLTSDEDRVIKTCERPRLTSRASAGQAPAHPKVRELRALAGRYILPVCRPARGFEYSRRAVEPPPLESAGADVCYSCRHRRE